MSGAIWDYPYTDAVYVRFTEAFQHAEGKHGAFKGRRYRRGRGRCWCCGALMNSKNKNKTAFKFKSFITARGFV